ncbi:MAG TPA: ADOP family duplicated permease [Thermoanaerobaculia bacterium]|nr:ADOP family duplicated permease [Thermoanaerobaculia bacterium]
MDAFLQDLRHAARSLLRRPGLAAVVILSLSLVIGASAAIFSYVSFLLWEELPARDPDRLVSLNSLIPEGTVSSSYPDYLDLRDQSRDVLADLAAVGITSTAVDSGAETLHAWLHLVTGNYFALLGMDARLGRFLTDEDDRAGAGRAVVLSHRFWMRAFGGDPAAVGRTARLNGYVFTIVGVMPERFVGTGLPADAYVTVSQEGLLRAGARDHRQDRGYEWLGLVGRLRPGVGVPAAQGVLGGLAARLHPETPERRLVVAPAGTIVDPDTRAFLLPTAWKTLGFVLLLLLLACANVANLLIAGATDRLGDLGVRVAIGASRWSLVRGLVAESLLLALLGGALGVGFAVWGTRLIETYLNTSTGGLGSWGEGWADLRIDGRALGFTLGLSLLTGLLAGLLPALQASSRAVLMPALKGGPQAAGLWKLRWGRFGVREALVVAQVALSAALLAGTGLFARSLQKIYDVDPGFRSEKVLLASLSVADRPGETAVQRRETFRSLQEEVAALPGVAAAGLAFHIPLSGLAREVPVELPEGPGEVMSTLQVVTPGFFGTLGIPLVQGRDFTEADGPETPPVALVSGGLARRLWPGEAPLGRQVRLIPGVPGEKPRDCQVIGVVGDIRQRLLWEEPPPMVYLAYGQSSRRRMTLVVRGERDPKALLAPVRRVLGRRNVALIDLMPFSAHLMRSLWPQRMNVQIVAIFGALGLSLAALGVASAMSAAVSRRTREIGIRMALGATPRIVLWRELRHAFSLIALGAGLGLAATLGAAKLLASFIPGVETVPEPLVLAAVALVLFGVGSLASWHPARRAARVDPLVALRQR